MNNGHNIISQNEIPLIKNLFDFYKNLYLYLKTFPKKDKYTLGCKCECYVIEVLELSLEASSTLDRNEKKALLKRISVKFDALKFFIRLAKELNVLDNKKYLTLQKQIQEIGKMIGGWQKSLNS